MASQLNEIKRNLNKIWQFDLVDALGPESIPAREMAQVLKYTRCLVAINGCRSAFAARIKAEILAGLWGYAAGRDDGEYLRMRIMIAIEQLVREHNDIDGIRGELSVLATAYEVSYGESHDLYELSQLVHRADFTGLARALHGLCPSTKFYVQVFGRAHHYHKTGNMDGIAYDQVLQEAAYPWR
jgi:hypothetical protein